MSEQMNEVASEQRQAGTGAKRAGVAGVVLGSLRQVNFLVAVVVLLAAAVGLNASVQFLQLHFKKEPVPMAMKFADAMPAALGPWVRVAKDETIDADTLAALGTEEFLFCSYVNAKALNLTVEQVQRMFAGKSYREQLVEVERLREQNWAAVLTVGLTYYTGKADTVAHIPERCYVGNGYEPVNPQSQTWALADGREVPVRYIQFEDQVGRSVRPKHVAYFFHVNGALTEQSLNVRYALQDLRTKHGYYAKFEVMCVTPNAVEEGVRKQILETSQGSMKAFLAQGLPAFGKAMPDWGQYEKK